MAHQPVILLRVFLPFAAGYFLSYLFRVVNAVIAPDLVADTGIGPAALGLLTATYFISFAAFQLPLGVLLDRYGPRRTESILLIFAGLGAVVFAAAESLSGLIIGRALIGFGVSACLMAAFKAYTSWFSEEQWPMINGLQMGAGGLGALTATAPVEILLGITDWRNLFFGLAILCVLVAVVLYLVVPRLPHSQTDTPPSPTGQWAGIGSVFNSRIFWCIAPLATMSQATFLSVQGLWAGPWLRDVVQLERGAAATVLLWITVAMVAGFISLGAITSRLVKRGVSMTICAVTGMALFMISQLMLLVVPLEWNTTAWLCFGFFGTTGILAYPALTREYATELSGRVTTGLNLLVFVMAFVCQWLIGAIIELWPLTADGAYDGQGFYLSFTLLLVIQAIAMVWFVINAKQKKNSVAIS
ncbi:MAG: MFS transporter [Desulfofustis sp. PB-SRB1]|jgi:MFS family permease|nr:MFS transporter [Desulfofustis sp. PB-SRB1]MBM1003297.1 MFS transporter [Desulfofustis sp. PB-SRB1]HBH29586.1 MFS transporter [Desulfofustis sp.]HBH32147.1 MFS transporter [Desulfofustis sp.]